MGAPVGNQNARKGRLFEQALLREIKQRDLREGEGETLRKMAAALIDRGHAGDLPAIKEVVDRLDGKPHQSISGPDGGPLEFANVTDTEVARRYAFALSRAAISKARQSSKESA